MRARLLSETIKAMYDYKRTTCIEGSPGVGKTSLIRQVAEELNVEYREVHMPTRLVEDFGIPYPNGDVLKYIIPDWFPTDPNSRGILCFDDRNQASADLQKVLANICQARNLHGTPLPDGWMVVSTGNHQRDRAGANRVLSHLRDRETVLQMDTNIDDWTHWALRNGVRSEVISFIAFASHLLCDFDPNRDKNATPRGWVEGVSPALGVVPAAAEFDTFAGSVGDGAASDFVAYLKTYREVPDIDELLKDPDNAKLPTEPMIKYATVASIAARMDTKNIANAIKYMDRLPGEFGVLGVSLAIHRDSKLVGTKEFAKWGINNADILL